MSADPPAPAEDYEDLYENAPCGYLSVQPDGRVSKANATVLAWLGYPPGGLSGMRVQELLTLAGRIFYETHFAPLLRLQGKFDEVALDFVARDGRRIPALVNAAERRDAEGRHLFTRLTLFNATDRRRYERDLVAARAAADEARRKLEELNAVINASLLDAQAASALREQFIAVLGHDLRNPLAAIGAGLTLLRKTPLDGRATEVVGLMQGSVGRMAGLIDNIMDFASGRLGGGVVLDRGPAAPVEPVLRQVIAELQAVVPDRVVEARLNAPAPVSCDRRRLGQLASNLLGNALTHGAPGQPVRVEALTDGGWFELSVANGGDPIPEAMLATIFEPFARGEHRASLQGLGLGLYISHEIARAHGGTLEVASTPAETRFTFRMPAG